MSFFPRLLAAPRQEDQPGPGHPDRHLVRHLRHELPEPVPGPERVRLLRLQGHRRRGGRLRVVRQHHQERAARQQHRIKTLILPFFHKRSLTCVSCCRNSTMLTPPASAPVPERKHLKPLSVPLDTLYAPFFPYKNNRLLHRWQGNRRPGIHGDPDPPGRFGHLLPDHVLQDGQM